MLDTDKVQKYIEMLGQKKCVNAGGPQQNWLIDAEIWRWGP